MIGSHLSIAGGLVNAAEQAAALELDCVQVFTKNQQQWKAKPLDPADVAAWKAACQKHGFARTVSHDSYLINLGSPDDALWNKSMDLFLEEVRRCDTLGIPYLVTHPGAHMGEGEDAGLERVAKALDVIHRKLPKSKTVTCLESTAGQGTSLGHRLEHLRTIIDRVEQPERLGVCLDTAHLFAAGYDFRGDNYAGFRKTLSKTIGLRRVKVWHLNDSKKPLGSRVDRHDHIGLGTIGPNGFKPIMNDAAWQKVPKILETPKGEDEKGRDWDLINSRKLRRMVKRA